MAISVKRLRSKSKINALHYLRCCAKTVTFLFWACIYLAVMKFTIFKSSVKVVTEKDEPSLSDNYTKWLLQGPVLGEDAPEVELNDDWSKYNDSIIELERRAVKVREVCRKRDISTEFINSKEFFVDHAHNLVWCNIFKAASSSWLYKFNILGGYDKKFLSRTRHTPLTLARKKFPRPSEEELRDAINTPGIISLLVVREPFVRLLSAYRDKLENLTPPYYRKLSKSIVAVYRENATKVFGPIKSTRPMFYEFIAYLIKRHKANDKEFTFDEHWAPYYAFCTPCAVNFTVIGKVETLARDSAYVIQQLGLSHILENRIRDRRTRIRTVMNKSRDGKNTTALLKHYFSQLDSYMLNELLKIYNVDFEMFGYDPKIYYDYIRR